MKVLHVGFSDTDGGAAIATYRLHTALIEIGIDSRLAVLQRESSDPTIVAPLGRNGRIINFVGRGISRAIRLLESRQGETLRSINWAKSGLANWINKQDAEVVNFHWIGAETLSVTELANVAKPIVWTLHDMWAFCGTEHYADLGCKRYQLGYAPESRRDGSRGLDIDAWNYRRKSRVWAGSTFHLACPSVWMARLAGGSSLLGRMPNYVIPNGIDTNVFLPNSRVEAREFLNLPRDHTYVLFGASNATTDPRKGFTLLLDSLDKLNAEKTPNKVIELLVFGSEADTTLLASKFRFPIRSLGNVRDPRRLAAIYSAANVFVASSIQDNLPNTLIEAHSCGTPCAAFDVGGIPDIVVPNVTGFLATPFDTGSLAESIDKALIADGELMRNTCRKRAVDHFSALAMANRYVELYRTILGNSSKKI